MMSGMVSQRRSGFSSNGRSFSAAPFILYRTETYSSLRTRGIFYFRKARLRYLSHPAVSRCFLFVGKMVWSLVLYLIALGSLPFLLVTFLVLQIFRKALQLLVKRKFPNVILADDSSPRPLNLSNPGKTTFTPEDLVTSIIWVKGRLDLHTIQSSLESRILPQDSSLHLLRKIIQRRYFLEVWEDSASAFSISQHVSLGPSNWGGKLMSDEPLRDLSGYSVLQRFIGDCVSTPRDPELPPWEVKVIQLPYNRTLLLLRFHKLLLKDKAVVKMFLSSLGQNSVQDEERMVFELDDISDKDVLPFGEIDGNQEEVLKPPTGEGKLSWDVNGKEFLWSLNQELKSFFSDLGSWIALRARQAHYCNSRLAVLQSVIQEASANFLKPGSVLKRPLSCLLSFVGKTVQFFLAVLHTPKILLNNSPVLCGRNPRKFGFFLREGEEKALSWSKPVGSDFLHEVAGKGEVSEEAVILTGISMGLNDYYRENCISNLRKVGTIISSNTELQKYLFLNVGMSDVPKEIVSLDHHLASFPAWKQKSLSYLRNLSTQVLPSFLSFHLVQKSINDQFPVQVNFIDTASSFPNFTFWGRNVEEFSFWKEPATPCISITVIKYSGSFRVSVSSPFKSLDSFLSHRFPQYLNHTAELLGLDRSRIPYSRKSSPINSNASSPPELGVSTGPSPASLSRRIRSCHSLIVN